MTVAALVRRVRPAVRYIRTADGIAGSGFVMTTDGYVVTNSHVLDGSQGAHIGTHAGREEYAPVVADDPNLDLALLKLPSDGPYLFVDFGHSSNLELGADLIILGYPLEGETLTVTRGVLSARRPNWLQTDATANPGNSGGPAFNLRGEVIGVVTAKLGGGAVQRVENANFLIDGDLVRRTVEHWITRHRAGILPLPQRMSDVAAWSAISVSGSHSCGVRTNGAVECWGANSDGQTSPPPGAFESVSAGSLHTCGVRTDGTIKCWGADSNGQSTAPSGSFQSVSAGSFHTCGVRIAGTVECWGGDSDGQASPPPGAFQSVSSGWFHTCGVRTDGTVECWGSKNLNLGQATPPPGTFKYVNSGWYHTCGLRTDGRVVCWGANKDGSGNHTGQAEPLSGTFQDVSAGALHTCGVRAGGAIACWGWSDDGQASPPTGTFQSVSAGVFQSCAVRINGLIACWGRGSPG